MRPTSLPLCAAVAWALAAAGPARAVSTSFWLTDTAEGFESGRASGVSVLEEGALALSPASERADVPDAAYVWAAVPGAQGVAYVAAGTPGQLYELADGKLTLLFEDATADFPAVAVGHGGDVFVGTAPGGQVYRVKPDGTGSLFYDTGQGYVWSMAYSREHGLLVGTGSSAKVFSLGADGKARVVLESQESSITALVCSGDRVLAGTSGEGLLMDITPGRPATVLFDSSSEEISAIVAMPGGEIYFAGTDVSLSDALSTDPESRAELGVGAVWRTTPAGGAVGLWQSADTPVTALGLGPDGGVWAGSGAGGVICSVGSRGKSDLIADLDEEEVLSITGAGARTLVTTGVPGAVYSFHTGAGRAGSYESEPLRGGSVVSTWGEMMWRGETPGGSRLSFFTRSGNTVEPDDTWSPWAAVEDRGRSQGAVASPPAQRLQWRVELARGAGGASPVLRAVEISYLSENLPPRLASLVVRAPGDAASAEEGQGRSSATQLLPGGLQSLLGGEATRSETRELPSLLRGLRAAEWEVVDPNDDRIGFELWLRGEDERTWKLVEKDLTAMSYAFDTQAMADGFYRVKIVASDALDNRPETAGTDSLTSAPFLVDGGAPSIADVDVRVGRGRATVRGAVADALSPIDRVEIAIDYGEWRPAFADDGMFDSPDEGFHLEIEDVAPGEHTVAVRAVDRAGNSAAVTRVLR